MVGLFIDKDAYFRSGLAKSAFHGKIYESLPFDYYLPFITSTQRVFREFRLYPKLYQTHDAFLMYYKPYDIVYQALKKTNKVAPLWRLVIEKTLRDPKFLDLNKITQNSAELSILAATKFLRALYKLDIERLQQQYKDTLNAISQPSQTPAQQSATSAQQSTLNSLISVIDEVAKDAIQTTLETVQEYREAKESAEEAISALSNGQGGSGFSKEALSVISFLERPDDFRKRVKLLKYARAFYSKFLATVPTSLTHEQIVSVYGGINGVTKMFSEKQISDILPSELALAQFGDVGRALLATKIVQKQLMTYQRSASLKPIVFVDKSGSMAERFDLCEGDSTENPMKISVAAGLALALYRKLNANVYLFDTELEKVDPSKIIEVLLKIEANGGTDIDPVLSEIVHTGKQEHAYIIISDGITEASSSVLEEFKGSGLAKRTKMILVPPAFDSYSWVYELKKYNNVMYAKDIAEFEKATKRALDFRQI